MANKLVLLGKQFSEVCAIFLSAFGHPEAFGERSRDWSLCHAGDEGPHLSMTGESRGCKTAVSLNSNPLIPIPVKTEELNMSFNPFIVS